MTSTPVSLTMARPSGDCHASAGQSALGYARVAD